jgi:ABC-type phosphate transport system substrate-binding protein
MRRRVTAAVLASAIWACTLPVTAGDEPAFQVVVHPANPVTTLRRHDVEALFLRRVKRWNHDVPANPVDQSEQSAIRAEFTRAVLRRSLGDLRTYWQHQVLRRVEVPPRVRATDDEVVRDIRLTPGGIGYVSAQANLDGVKVVRIVR